MQPLSTALADAARAIRPCTTCGNLDTIDPCSICADSRRDTGLICVVEDVGDLWAMERAKVFSGHYHVLGGTLSALDGIGPDELNIAGLLRRVGDGCIREIIVATNATVDGQTTAHYLAERLGNSGVPLTRLAHGVPVGGELDWLDDGTLATALKARRAL
jgi:recombination protein RecR